MIKEQNLDFISVPKDTFKCIINDFEHLLEDFESIAEAETMKTAEKRLAEIKEGRVKALEEKEFREFMRHDGTD